MNVILDISRALFEENWTLETESPEDGRVIDLGGLEGCCCYCDDSAAELIRASIAGLGPEGIHWIDTGDYHYISLFWMEKIREPFSLVLFDNHPDDMEPAFGAELLSCGGWVGTARRTLPLLEESLWNRIDSREDLPVYLSIDIDVLSEEYASTDWSQGEMTLDELTSALEKLLSTRRVIGIDICGGLSTEKGALPKDLEKNRKVRERLLECILGLRRSFCPSR